MKLYFSPLTITGKWANFEVHGCVEEDGHIHQVDNTDEQPEFYSVYIRYLNEEFRGLECIADCDDKDEADQFVRFLEKLIDFHLPNQEAARKWWYGLDDAIQLLFIRKWYPQGIMFWEENKEFYINQIFNREIIYPK